VRVRQGVKSILCEKKKKKKKKNSSPTTLLLEGAEWFFALFLAEELQVCNFEAQPASLASLPSPSQMNLGIDRPTSHGFGQLDAFLGCVVYAHLFDVDLAPQQVIFDARGRRVDVLFHG